jgi:DNA helicase-4
MELKSTSFGKHLAQHPYNRVRLLNAGVEVSGDKHHYLIPFNQLINIRCKRGIVWGELEFELPEQKVVRLHGTEWQETQRFYHHLLKVWESWSQEMSEVSAGVLQQQVENITRIEQQDSWFKRSRLAEVQTKIKRAFEAIPVPVERLVEFDNCRDDYETCLRWLNQGAQSVVQRNLAWTEQVISQNRDFFDSVETSPLNDSQCRAVVNGEDAVLVLAGAGSGKTSVLVARAGWLLRRQEALPEQILLLAFGRQAADEMNTRIKERLQIDGIKAKTFHALALQIIQEGSKKVPKISKLETDSKACRSLLVKTWQQQCAEKKAQASGWRQWLTDELEWDVPEGDYWKNKALAERLGSRLERWLGLMRSHGGSQAEMVEQASDEVRELFQKRVRLMAPLMKAWKAKLKEEEAVSSVRGSTFWSMNFRTFRRSVHGYCPHCVSKTARRHCLQLGMTGRRFTALAAPSLS